MLTFVTVVYRADLDLLRLQARSLARFADPAGVAAIRVLVNDADETSVAEGVRAMVPDYGLLADRVEVLGGDAVLGQGRARWRGLRARYLNRLPGLRRVGWRGNNGYRMQQAMKLAAARIAPTEDVVLLDAKNVLLAPVARADFFAPDGRARTTFLEVAPGPHRNWLAEALRAMGSDLTPEEVHETTTYVTPFAVRRSVLSDVLAAVEARHGPVDILFASKLRPSEFMLINVHCLSLPGGLSAAFEGGPWRHAGIWPDHDEEAVAATLNRLEAGELLSIGLHYRALSRLPCETLDRLAQAMARRGLGAQDAIAGILRTVGAANRG